MEDYTARTIVNGVISWGIIFLLVRKLFWRFSFGFSNRIVSTIHATLAVVLSSMSVQDWRCPVCPLSSRSSLQQMQTLAISLSYMVYDLICCQLGNRLTVDNSVHHLVSIIGLGAGLAYQKCGSEMMAALWITEISTPLLHLREFLKEFGYRDTNINLLADMLFAASFSIARMLGGPYLTYLIISANNPFLIKAMAMGLQLVSAFWFFKILRMVNYKLMKRRMSKKVA